MPSAHIRAATTAISTSSTALRVPWLAGKDGSFQVWRASPEGGVSGPQVVGMDDGLVRWTIHGGESVGMVGGAA